MSDQATTSQYTTPANVPNNRKELHPLPLRVASSQLERLTSARDRTGISIQEHVRRAIDIYLANIEREAIDLGLMPPLRAGAHAHTHATPRASNQSRPPPVRATRKA